MKNKTMSEKQVLTIITKYIKNQKPKTIQEAINSSKYNDIIKNLFSGDHYIVQPQMISLVKKGLLIKSFLKENTDWSYLPISFFESTNTPQPTEYLKSLKTYQ